MDLRLDGKVALVTGGSRGIGRAIAARFAEAGAAVMLAARKAEALEQTASDLAGLDGAVAWHAAHAGDPDAARRCVDATVEHFGSVDVLVNNAATNPYFGPLMELDLARAEKTAQVNQIAALTWTQEAWRASMQSGGGVVINVSSIGGFSVEPGIGWYNVTKAALIHITRQLAYELGPTVRVNCIMAGPFLTDVSRVWDMEAFEQGAQRFGLKRGGRPEEVVGAALYFASDASSFTTGAVLRVDGGIP